MRINNKKGRFSKENIKKYKVGRPKRNSQKKMNDILIKISSNILIIIVSNLLIFLLLSCNKYIINIR